MANYTPLTAPDPNQKGWPGGIKYIIGNEGCERFSYYGMRAILYMYIVGLYINYQDMSDPAAAAAATETNHLFGAAVYALPMIGALIADRLLGKYKTILYLSVVYCLGHLVLALFEQPEWQREIFGTVLLDPVSGLYLGLGLIAVGSGGIKPCVSAHVGDQFGKGNWHLLEKVYNMFYFIINFGSAFATLIIPAIRGERIVDAATGMVSYTGSVSLAFGVPGILMGIATIFFWMGRKEFIHVPPTHPGKRGLLDVLSGTSLFMVVGIWMFFRFLFQTDLPNGEHETNYLALSIASVISFVLFLIFFYSRQRIERDDGVLAVTMYRFFPSLFTKQRENGSPPPVNKFFSAEAIDGANAVWRIFSVFLMVAVFWALFDQHSSTWIAQAASMDLQLSMGLGGWLGSGIALGLLVGLAVALSMGKNRRRQLIGGAIGLGLGVGLGLLAYFLSPDMKLQPSQVPALNPFMVMILIPLTTFGVYPLLNKLGLDMKPLRRMTLGMIMASVSFASVALIQHAIDAGAETGDKVHIAWQLIPYFIITSAEVMVSITGLEFGYSQAPKRVKSVIMGLWLLMVSLGNILVALLAGLKSLQKEPATFFWVFAAIMLVAALLFGLRAKFYKYQDYTQ